MGPSSYISGVMALLVVLADAQCPDYSEYSKERHAPFSTGKYQLSYMRPEPSCRTFNSSAVESTIAKMQSVIADPDLYRLFQNAYPNTLDTAIRWRGRAADDADEELAFVITGDIDAAWLRDSSNQMQSYLPLLRASNGTAATENDTDSIASLYRGVINLQARYLLTSPYCNSFQPPAESKIPPATNGAAAEDTVKPGYNNASVFECKYELDSLAAFLEISSDYYSATGDAAFFGKFKWMQAVQAVLDVAKAMMTPTYGDDGHVLESPYTFTRLTTRATETLANNGLGSPVAAGTGLVRSAFRPSDDSTLYQLFIPANMMFSRYITSAAEIMTATGSAAPSGLADEMKSLASSIRAAIEAHGKVSTAEGDIYAFEVDGYGGAIVMDDANIPSLLSAPFFGYLNASDATYQRTRAAILRTQPSSNSAAGNPYFFNGPVLSAVGGPHQGPGYAWPMASIVRILTSDDDNEIKNQLAQILSSTAGLGLVHESVNSFNESDWTRQWFSWANGLFGQMILDLAERKPEILAQSFQ